MTAEPVARNTIAEEEAMVVERLRKLLESGDFERLEDVYAADALLDVNVPAWRFQRQGPGEIIAQFKDWYLFRPARIITWKERPTEWGAVVEFAALQGQGGEEIYCREIHVLVTRDDRITEHISYCTGLWDKETVARQRADAPMVRA